MTRRCVELAALTAAVNDDRAREDVRRYFATNGGGQPRFTGAHFNKLSRAEHDENIVTAADIIAVQMLSVVVPGPVALNLLDGALGIAIADHLRLIPTYVDLGTPEAAEHIRQGGPAERAWKLLNDCDGVGWVIAGKILARKRPRLLPIYDTVIRCVYHPPKRAFWQCLHERLLEDNGKLKRCLDRLRTDVSGVADEVSEIRLLDIVLWMRHRGEHRPYNCRGLEEVD